MKINKIQGLVAATFTPMFADGSVNLSAIDPMIENLLAHNVKTVYLCGSTGEGPSLSIDERIKIVETFKKYSKDRLKIIVNVGHNCLDDAICLANHASKLNAYAISATVPTYYAISDVETLVEAMGKIASGAPKLPFYYYHIPHLTGADISMINFLELGAKHIPNLAGIKYTAANLHEYRSCVTYQNNKFDILYGKDEMLLGALANGAEGFIGSTYNFAPFLYHNVIEHFKKGDVKTACEYQDMAGAMVDLIIKYKGLPSQKSMMALIFQDCGPVRLPLINLKPKEVEALKEDMQRIGFFAELSKAV